MKTCNFCDEYVSSIIRDHIVLGIHDADTQTNLLKEQDLTLDKCILASVKQQRMPPTRHTHSIQRQSTEPSLPQRARRNQPTFHQGAANMHNVYTVEESTKYAKQNALPGAKHVLHVKAKPLCYKCPPKKQVNQMVMDEATESHDSNLPEEEECIYAVGPKCPTKCQYPTSFPRPLKEMKCRLDIGNRSVTFRSILVQVSTSYHLNTYPIRLLICPR